MGGGTLARMVETGLKQRMKILLAFDSFKGCMTAGQACHAAAEGVHAIYPDWDTVEIPLSDGGEGLVRCVEDILKTTSRTILVHGPLMEPVSATYALSADRKTAYMEMATASGLPLVAVALRDAMAATTYGVGEMIADALQQGCQHIVMGIGGSATTDGGKGMIRALTDLGYLDDRGNRQDELIINCRFTVACDVTNPLYGPQGAAYIYGPQKGATPQQVVQLDNSLRQLAKDTELAGLATPELAVYPGTGAAGGLGYGLLAYLKAELKSGIDVVLDITSFGRHLENATLVITGEGKSDEQTLMGKVPQGVLKRATTAGVPVWLLSGAIEDANDKLADAFDLTESINQGDDRPLETLMHTDVAQTNLKNTVINILQQLL